MTAYTTLIVGLFLGAAGAWFVTRFAVQCGLIDIPNNRSSHSIPTPRGGGVGLLATFLVCGLWGHIPGQFLFSGVLLSLLSFFDDRLNLSVRVRLFCQVGAACCIVWVTDWSGGSLTTLFFPIATVGFIVGTTNIYNFMDGINGLAGVTGCIGFGGLYWYSTLSDSGATLSLLALGLSGACIGFLPFNLPSAKVFMGDVGSILLGFTYASLCILFATDFNDFICLISFLFPFYADSISTLILRWYNGEQLSKPHRRHLYQLLANELKMQHWQVTAMYGLAQIATGISMLFAWQADLIWQVLLLGGVSVVYFFLMKKVRRLVREDFNHAG